VKKVLKYVLYIKHIFIQTLLALQESATTRTMLRIML